MKLYGFCKKDQTPVLITENIFLVDGYNFGDRLLEGVMFEITFNDRKVIKVIVDKECEDYFEGLNTKKWLKECKEYAENILETGDEVDLPERIKIKYNVDDGFLSDSEKNVNEDYKDKFQFRIDELDDFKNELYQQFNIQVVDDPDTIFKNITSVQKRLGMSHEEAEKAMAKYNDILKKYTVREMCHLKTFEFYSAMKIPAGKKAKPTEDIDLYESGTLTTNDELSYVCREGLRYSFKIETIGGKPIEGKGITLDRSDFDWLEEMEEPSEYTETPPTKVDEPKILDNEIKENEKIIYNTMITKFNEYINEKKSTKEEDDKEEKDEKESKEKKCTCGSKPCKCDDKKDSKKDDKKEGSTLKFGSAEWREKYGMNKKKTKKDEAK